jgi:hypothetical protein
MWEGDTVLKVGRSYRNLWSMEKLIELDAKRRAVIGKLGQPDHTRYLARDYPDGTIVLTPAVVMPIRQARFMADGDRVERITEQLQQPETHVDMTAELEEHFSRLDENQ